MANTPQHRRRELDARLDRLASLIEFLRDVERRSGGGDGDPDVIHREPAPGAYSARPRAISSIHGTEVRSLTVYRSRTPRAAARSSPAPRSASRLHSARARSEAGRGMSLDREGYPYTRTVNLPCR